MARRHTESNLVVEIVASVDVYCKLISNVERHIYALSGFLRSCAVMHTQVEAADCLLSCTQNQVVLDLKG